MRFAITGANGFIGSYLVHYLREQGHEVAEWVRTPKNATQQQYNLNLTDNIPDLNGIEVLIHTAYVAYDKKAPPQAMDINIAGTLALEKVCRQKGVHFIFLSSLSAHESAISVYGKQKFTLENSLSRQHSLVLKLGLVIGNDGLFQRMVNTILRLPILPLPDGGKQAIQIVAISDVAKTILHCALQKRTGKYLLAHPEPYSIKQLYTAIALHFKQKIWVLNIPVGALYPIVYTAEKFAIKTGVTLENLKGLAHSRYYDTAKDLNQLGATLLPLSAALAELKTKKEALR